jgi:hypothetical protein
LKVSSVPATVIGYSGISHFLPSARQTTHFVRVVSWRFRSTYQNISTDSALGKSCNSCAYSRGGNRTTTTTGTTTTPTSNNHSASGAGTKIAAGVAAAAATGGVAIYAICSANTAACSTVNTSTTSESTATATATAVNYTSPWTTRYSAAQIGVLAT